MKHNSTHGVKACPKGKGICGDVAPEKRCFTCPVPDQSIQDLRTDATQESDDFKAAVLRCRYPVCKTIHPSGWGWATSRLNEVIADHACVTDTREARPLGCALAMRIMQSELYQQLDDAERADCDELVRQNLEWFKRDSASGVGGTDGR